MKKKWKKLQKWNKIKNGSKAKNESTEEMDKIQMKNLSLCFGVR